MDLVGLSLALVAMLLFLAALGVTARPVKKGGLSPDSASEDKSVVVRLPGGNFLPRDYTLDIRISLSGDDQELNRGKVEGKRPAGKKLYRRLDEYM